MQRRNFGFYVINSADVAYEQYQRGLIDRRELRETLNAFLGVLSQNLWMQDQLRQYSRLPGNYDPEFIAYIDEEMARGAEEARALGDPIGRHGPAPTCGNYSIGPAGSAAR